MPPARRSGCGCCFRLTGCRKDARRSHRWQVERTCAAVAAVEAGAAVRLAHLLPEPGRADEMDRDYRRSKRSNGPCDGVGVLVDPIAFVSEHIETLVELDRDYALVAEVGCAAPYIRCRRRQMPSAVHRRPVSTGGIGSGDAGDRARPGAAPPTCRAALAQFPRGVREPVPGALSAILLIGRRGHHRRHRLDGLAGLPAAAGLSHPAARGSEMDLT